MDEILTLGEVVEFIEKQQATETMIKNYPLIKSFIAGLIDDGKGLSEKDVACLNLFFAISWFKELWEINEGVK
jgi:hypothetical protein